MTKNQNHIILIAGMHRSGTSLVAGLCQILGATVGPELMPAHSEDNAKGFWEDTEIVALHNQMFEACGLNHESIDPLPQDWRQRCQAYEDALKQHLKTHYLPHALTVVKDPRMARFMPLWLDVLQTLNLQPHVLIPYRNPLEIAGSLKKRDKVIYEGRVSVFSEETYTLIWWLAHVLEVAHYTRDLPHHYFPYASLLDEQHIKVIETLQKALEVPWEYSVHDVREAIAELISPDLKHHRFTEEDLAKLDVLGMVSETLSAFESLSKTPNQKRAWDKLANLREQFLQQMAWYQLAAKAQRDAKEYEMDVKLRERITSVENLYHEANVKLAGHEERLKDMEKEMMEFGNQVHLQHLACTELVEHYQHALEGITDSTFWRMTWPARFAIESTRHHTRHFKKFGLFLKPSMYKYGLEILRSEGIDGVKRRLRHYYGKPQIGWEDYIQWFEKFGRVSDDDRDQIKAHMKTFSFQPKISLVMPVYDTDRSYLARMIQSVRSQLYPHWEFCIVDDASPSPHVREVLEAAAAEDPRIKLHFRKENGHIAAATNDAIEMAEGNYIGFVDHDDMLAEHALYAVVETLNRYPDAQLIYSDEDKIDEQNRHHSPHFKSDWNPTLFMTNNFICHFTVCKADIVREVGGIDGAYNGCQDYEFLLRVTQAIEPETIHHIPLVLYHWRTWEQSTAADLSHKPYVHDNTIKALQHHAQQLLPGANASDAKVQGTYRVDWPLPKGNPEVTIVIPTRNAAGLMKTCIDSILNRTEYQHYRIMIIDNQSDEKETLDYFASLADHPKITIWKYDAPFDYAKMHNEALKRVDTPFVCFLNNDIELLSPGWLTQMLMHFSFEDVGAVGAKLLYPDRTMQHFGMLMGGGYSDTPVACHYFYDQPGDEAGYMARAQLPQDCGGVTAACLLTRTELFKELDGFDERLAIAFNDVDYCLKLTDAGHRIIVTPYAEAIHHESASRGKEDTPEKQARCRKEIRYIRQKWGEKLLHDSYYNPNLNQYRGDFSLAWPPRVTKSWAIEQEGAEEKKQKAA